MWKRTGWAIGPGQGSSEEDAVFVPTSAGEGDFEWGTSCHGVRDHDVFDCCVGGTGYKESASSD